MNDEAFNAGYEARCAELGIQPEVLAKTAQGLFSRDTMKQLLGVGKEIGPSRNPQAKALHEKANPNKPKVDYGNQGTAPAKINKNVANKSVSMAD
jgi:hypothetical protein